MSWDAKTTATTRSSEIMTVAWSPCNRFIAIALADVMAVEVLDSATLQRLQTLQIRQGRFKASGLLIFSPDSHILSFSNLSYGTTFAVSWDLQTGGLISVIEGGDSGDLWGEPFMTYSANAKMVGAHHAYLDSNLISIFDISSGVCMRSHSPTGIVKNIWTHGESLRFVAISKTATTIWEVGFTSDAIPTMVETFPPIGGDTTVNHKLHKCIGFHPAPYRFAFSSDELNDVGVWDVQKSKLLLSCRGTGGNPRVSFSSDGRFFACSTPEPSIHLWKESPTGYILHNTLATSIVHSHPLLSPNGESIVVFGGSTIQLWRTKGFTTTPSNVSTQTRQHTQNFVLEFSPDGMFAAFATLKGETVTVLNLKSGVPRLTIDASMEVHGLGATGNAITVIGFEKVITWDLPTGDRVPDAKMTLEDSARTVKLDLGVSQSIHGVGASISPDSCHIAVIGSRNTLPWWCYLHVCSWSGSFEGSVDFADSESAPRPWFAPSGCNLWVVDDDGEGRMIEVGCSREVLQDPERGVDIESPPEGYPWKSSRGYRVTKDWWILGPDGKRLLMLPPPWQSPKAVLRMWKGKFLALLHYGPSEPVILEVEP